VTRARTGSGAAAAGRAAIANRISSAETAKVTASAASAGRGPAVPARIPPAANPTMTATIPVVVATAIPAG